MTTTAPERLEEFRLFIDGRSVDALSGRTFESQNPYLGRPWARVADGGPEDVDVAVGAARAAFDGEWGQLTGFQRAAVMRACAEGIAANAERLARLEVQTRGSCCGRCSAR
jgi:aldehyde dehydrogenase (NAD+)